MDDKTKENTHTKEMKKTHGTERGSCDNIIKWMRDKATHMKTKLIA
jgi:hypothetical protein